jgi:hypothetical protein
MVGWIQAFYDRRIAMKIVGSIIGALLLVFVILMLAKADDLTVAQQELKATIEAKRMAALDKLLIAKQELERMAQEHNAKVDAVINEWKQAVNAAMKAYQDRETQRQDYQPEIRGSLFHSISWNEDVQRAKQDAEKDKAKEHEKWDKFSRDGMNEFAKNVADRPPYERVKIESEWQNK